LFRAAIRGGNWNNSSDSGIFALNLNNDPSNRNNNIGFRGALILIKAGVLKTEKFMIIRKIKYGNRRFDSINREINHG